MSVKFPKAFPAPQQEDPGEDHVNNALTHMVACAREGTAPGELWCPQCVAIDQATNHIYVADGDLTLKFMRVSIFSDTGEFLNSYSHALLKSIYGIAIHGDNLYVTDWELHAVFQIKIGSDFRLVARIGSKGSDLGQFNLPQQLSISTNGDLYIAAYRNHRIQILESSLDPIRDISHPSIHYPCDVKLTTDEMYVLSYQDNPCVHVFSYTGHKIRSLITRGLGMQVVYPSCLLLDTCDNLIISDYGTDQIKLFTNEGTVLHTLGKHGHEEGMFQCPNGVAITSNHKLAAVSWNKNYGIQIFSPI